MRRVMKKFERSIVFFLKACLYMALFGSFFLVLGVEHPQLLRMSRTAAITMLTFVVAGLGMTAAYGKYDIGKRKSKPIICSIGLATVITDIVTYLELSIMNVNPENNATLQFESVGLCIVVFGLQMACIVGFTYFGVMRLMHFADNIRFAKLKIIWRMIFKKQFFDVIRYFCMMFLLKNVQN